MTIRAPDAGKAAARIAAVEVALDDLLDDGPEKAVLPLEAALILCQEALEMMKKHPIEDGPLRMPGTIDSGHGRREVPGNGPTSRISPDLLDEKAKGQPLAQASREKNVNRS
jgi:hypothetical protein